MKLTLARRLGVLLLALGLTAAALPTVKPEEVGLSSDRLHRINQLGQRYIDQGQITGAITIVSRRGRVAHFEAQGQMDVAAKVPMRKDAIFRIVEIASGLTFDQFLKQRIFDPLEMTDTAFFPSPDRTPRVVTLYDDRDGKLVRTDTAAC